MVGEYEGEQLLISWQSGNREREREARDKVCLHRETSSDLLPPTRPHLPNMPSYYESIKY
jgi:hypothetical protein